MLEVMNYKPLGFCKMDCSYLQQIFFEQSIS